MESKSNFKTIFKSTIENIKKANAVLWILCLVTALFTIGGLHIENGLSSYKDTQYSDLSVNYVLEDELNVELLLGDEISDLEDDYLISPYNGDSTEESGFLINLFKECSYKFAPLLFVLVACAFLIIVAVSFVLSTVYAYFVNLLALETIDGVTLNKKSNLLPTILAQLLFSLKVAGLTLICSIFVVAGMILDIPMFVLFVIPVIMFIAYVCIKYGAIYYVGVKYEGLKPKEIMTKSKYITKGNILRILGYTILLGLLIFVVELPFSIITALFSFNAVLYSTVGFVIDVVVATIVNMVSILFMVNLYKALECEKNNSIDLVDTIK